MKGVYCESTWTPKSQLDRRSLRWKKSGKAWILIGCPRGQWNQRVQRCKVGTVAHKILSPKKSTRCTGGDRIVRK